jgi:hypothetical protein
MTLRGKPESRQLRLIALSGQSGEQDRFMTRSARFNAHLVKPILMTDVLRLVGRGARGRNSLGRPISACVRNRGRDSGRCGTLRPFARIEEQHGRGH